MKKRLAFVIAVVMTFASTAFAEGEPKVTLSGVYEAHNKVRVKTDNIGNIKNVIWYVDDIETAQGEEYVISDWDSGCELKAVVVDEKDNEYESNVKWIEEPLKKKEDSFEFSNSGDKSEYQFSACGEEFLLLDVTEDDNSKFLVVKKDPIGSRAFNTMVDFTSENSAQHFYDMSAFLNNDSAGCGYNMDDVLETHEVAADYRTAGYNGSKGYTQLPKAVYDHIDKEHVWKCEPVKIGQAYEYCVKGGIVLPSAAEVRKYPFAFYDVSDTWLRSARGAKDGNGKQALFLDGGKVSYDEYSVSKQLMPEFYLDREFFLENKVTQIGSEAMSMISKNYSMEELTTLYSEAELENLGYKKYIFISAEEDGSGTLDVTIQSNVDNQEELYIIALSYDDEQRLIGASCIEAADLAAGENIYSIPVCEGYSKRTLMLTDRSLKPMAKSFEQ